MALFFCDPVTFSPLTQEAAQIVRGMVERGERKCVQPLPESTDEECVALEWSWNRDGKWIMVAINNLSSIP